ncbi:hypothetical protein HHK36_013069 [Tetracentron sinense]|uniref:Methyltransferase-like protein 13 n=1 Tax=Tetracentron sinense TaxID=13715 RepID=A0A834Z994_TETSI|nr:hypothetical protein HHK36_013069 [Tetracentron sinense]
MAVSSLKGVLSVVDLPHCVGCLGEKGNVTGSRLAQSLAILSPVGQVAAVEGEVSQGMDARISEGSLAKPTHQILLGSSYERGFLLIGSEGQAGNSQEEVAAWVVEHLEETGMELGVSTIGHESEFTDETFDAVLDKGGLDALMEPELGPKLGSQYLSEVKRVLKSGAKFICLTLAESHVIGLLFSKFRFGWKINLHAIPHKPSNKPSFRTFMVVVEKDNSIGLHQIMSSFDHSSLDCNADQVRGLSEALENENNIRECSTGADILYSLEDLQLGAKGDLKEIIPGRRFQFTLGEQGESRFSYKAVLLDARQQSDSFLYHCGVFLVPKVLLDARHTHASMDDIQKDLSPLIKQLAPRKHENGAQIPFMMASDGVKQRNVVQQVTSTMTGPIIVEDVIYENFDGDVSGLISSKDLMFRRLTFQRSQGLVQSEALITREGSSQKILGQTEGKKTSSSSKSKKRGNQRRNDSRVPSSDESRNNQKVDHNYLASSYHTGIISGFMLIAPNLERVASSRRTPAMRKQFPSLHTGQDPLTQLRGAIPSVDFALVHASFVKAYGPMQVKTVVIGLGAGILPMFLCGCMPFLDIEVVELDPMILDVARNYFGFTEDKQLKVHIADGIQFVREVANIVAPDKVTVSQENADVSSKENSPLPNGSFSKTLEEGKGSTRIDILVIDADSSDSSSGMTCPPADFVEESFLLSVKESLSEQGLFVVNLVSRSPDIREMVISRIKAVFGHLFCLQLEEDVNEVLFALPSEVCIKEDCFPEAAVQFQKLFKFKHPERGQSIIDTTQKIKCLK